jgi:hypothetical protein
MFDLDTGPDLKWHLLGSLLGQAPAMSWSRRLRRLRFQPLVYRTAMLTGPMRLTRDVRIIQRQLIAEGRAVWLGQEFPPGPPPPPLDDVARAAARVRALFDQGTGTEEHPRPADRGRIDRPTEAATPRA